MNDSTDNDDTLQRAFQNRSPATDESSCFSAEEIYAALSDPMAQAARNKIIDHIAGCQQCALAWQLAGAIGSTQNSAPAEQEAGANVLPLKTRNRPTRRAPQFAWSAAAAVFLVAGLSLIFFQSDSTTPPIPNTFRGDGDNASAAAAFALTTEDSVAGTTLRWRYHDPAAVRNYTVRVYNTSLELVVEKSDYANTELYVPAEALDGANTLFWQVTAHLTDGREVASVTKTTILE